MNSETDRGRMPCRQRVLVVDDDVNLLAVYEDFLSNAGFYVEVCDDGYAALRRIKKYDFDIVILDLMMPNCSGFEVLLQLQRQEGPKPAVIVITGVYKDPVTVERIRREPVVVDFFFKPCRPSVLVEAMRRAVSAALPLP